MTLITPRPLFVFGTLLDLDVLEVVLGRRFDATLIEAARLPEFRCARVSDETYAVLVADPAATVEGTLLHGLEQVDWSRIRFFESDEYAVEQVEVVTAGGHKLKAAVCSAGAVAGVAENCNLRRRQRQHKTRFLAMAERYMS